MKKLGVLYVQNAFLLGSELILGLRMDLGAKIQFELAS